MAHMPVNRALRYGKCSYTNVGGVVLFSFLVQVLVSLEFRLFYNKSKRGHAARCGFFFFGAFTNSRALGIGVAVLIFPIRLFI